MTFYYGPYGALFGTLFSKAAMRAYGVIYVRLSTGWDFNKFLPVVDIFQFMGLCLGLGVLCILARPFFNQNLQWFLLAGTLFTAFYFSFVLLWKGKKYRYVFNKLFGI